MFKKIQNQIQTDNHWTRFNPNAVLYSIELFGFLKLKKFTNMVKHISRTLSVSVLLNLEP